jgi:hypothetical protein
MVFGNYDLLSDIVELIRCDVDNNIILFQPSMGLDIPSVVLSDDVTANLC